MYDGKIRKAIELKKTGTIKLAGEPCTEDEKTWEWQRFAYPTGICVKADSLSLNPETASTDCSNFDIKTVCNAWKDEGNAKICDYYNQYDKAERCKPYGHRFE